MTRRCWSIRGTLSPYDAAPTADDLHGPGCRASRFRKAAKSMSMHDAARSFRAFCPICSAISAWSISPSTGTDVRLATWLCRNLPEPSLTHASKQAFVAAWLTALACAADGFTLARANLQKFLIRNLIEARIRDLRKQAVGKAYQQTLFGDDAASRVAVTRSIRLRVSPAGLCAQPRLRRPFRPLRFPQALLRAHRRFRQQGGIRVRLLAGHSGAAGPHPVLGAQPGAARGQLFLPAEGRWPLLSGLPVPVARRDQPAILAVEYKGADRWTDAADDRLIGGLWAELSAGRCRFVMVKDKRWDAIEALLPAAQC